MLTTLSRIILKYPIVVLTGIAIITGFCFWSAFLSEQNLRVDFSLEQLFPESDPEKDVFDTFIRDFHREDDKIILVYECDNPTSRENIAAVTEITEIIELDIEGVEEVVSLSNIGGGEHFADDLNDSEWQARVQELLDHPIYPNLIISNDGTTGALLVDLADHVIGQSARSIVVKQLLDVLQSTKWEWHAAGIPVLRTRYVEFMNRERVLFMPISFLVALIVLFWIFRQIKCILIALLAISITLIWVAGIMAWLGITINVISYLTFNLLIIIGASNTIHLLMKYHEGLSQGLKKDEALLRVIQQIGGALFLTSFTTAVGFCSLIFTNIRITKEFGLIVGFGVILMFIITIIVMPIFLNFIRTPGKEHIHRLIQGGQLLAANKLNKWNSAHPFLILTVSIVLFIIAIFGLRQINYNASVMEDLRPGNALYDDLTFVEKKLGGTLPLEVIVDTRTKNASLYPEILNKMQSYKNEILQIPEINTAITPGDYLMLFNEEMGNGERELPSTTDDALSFVYDYDRVQMLLNEDYSKSRISCRIPDMPFERAMLIKDEIIQKGHKIFGNNIDIKVTGSTLLALSTNRHLVKNLTFSFFIAFIIIFLSMVLLFRSFRLALISILPNIIPLMIAGGMMGILGIKLRPSTAMTFSIALGIAVDNTIHFLARFRQEFRKNGDYVEAVSETLLTTGKAIISTGVILALGFIVLYFSEFVPNHEFGLLATIIIVSAACASLILLPVLILQIRPVLHFGHSKVNNKVT